MKNFLEQSQSQRQLLQQQQTVNTGRAPLDPRNDAAPKLHTKSIPSASFSNTPTLNIEMVSQENLRPPANMEASKNERPELKEANALKGTEAPQGRDLKKSPQLNAACQPPQQDLNISN